MNYFKHSSIRGFCYLSSKSFKQRNFIFYTFFFHVEFFILNFMKYKET